MRVGVFGAGAIGSLIAARMALAGHAVTVLARGDTLAAIRSAGIVLAARGHFPAEFNELGGRCDLEGGLDAGTGDARWHRDTL